MRFGFGCSGYWGDGWNVLDGSIVMMSIFEMVLTALLAGGGANISFLRILRMLRLVRMLRLMRSWKGLYKIVMTFGKALSKPQLRLLPDDVEAGYNGLANTDHYAIGQNTSLEHYLKVVHTSYEVSSSKTIETFQYTVNNNYYQETTRTHYYNFLSSLN